MSELKTTVLSKNHPNFSKTEQISWHLCDSNLKLSNFQQSCRFPSCQKQHTLNQIATSLFLLPTRRGGREKDTTTKGARLKSLAEKFSTFFIERSSRWTTALFVRSPLSWKGNCNKFGVVFFSELNWHYLACKNCKWRENRSKNVANLCKRESTQKETKKKAITAGWSVWFFRIFSTDTDSFR